MNPTAMLIEKRFANPDALFATMRPVTLLDQALFESYFARYPQTLHAYTFPSMLLWGGAHQHTYMELDGHLLVSHQKPNQERKLYAPIGPNPQQMMTDTLPFADGYVWSYIDEDVMATLPATLPLAWDRDMCDYVYDVEELRGLHGKKFNNKRNHLHHFEKVIHAAAADLKIVPLQGTLLQDCLDLYDAWAAHKKETASAEDYEEVLLDWAAFKMAIAHFEPLHLFGLGIVVNGRLEAFAIGEKINVETVGLLFSKSRGTYSEALTVAIHSFITSLAPEFTLLNRAIDGGIQKLRDSKEGWHPIELSKNYAMVR